MLNLDQPYIMLEEKLNTHFDNQTSTANENFEPPLRKESHKRNKDADKGTYGRYDKYTPLNTSLGKIYRECANIEFRKAGF